MSRLRRLLSTVGKWSLAWLGGTAALMGVSMMARGWGMPAAGDLSGVVPAFLEVFLYYGALSAGLGAAAVGTLFVGGRALALREAMEERAVRTLTARVEERHPGQVSLAEAQEAGALSRPDEGRPGPQTPP